MLNLNDTASSEVLRFLSLKHRLLPLRLSRGLRLRWLSLSDLRLLERHDTGALSLRPCLQILEVARVALGWDRRRRLFKVVKVYPCEEIMSL